jgi:hypothetical protein
VFIELDGHCVEVSLLAGSSGKVSAPVYLLSKVTMNGTFQNLCQLHAQRLQIVSLRLECNLRSQ